MSPLTRRLFFWLLTVVFLGTTPVIIFYFMGYRYNFKQGIFIYTGSVTIQANPTQNLAIQIDGESVSSITDQINRSYHIEGIRPGKHRLSVSAPGFTTWSKEITVKSGLSTEFWNVLLAREQYGQSALPVPEGSLAFFPSPDGSQLAALSQKNGETFITLLDPTRGDRRQIFSTVDFSPDGENPVEILRWSPRSRTHLLASLRSNETGEAHTFIIRTDPLSATDLKDIVRVPQPRDAQWESGADSILFLSGAALFELPIETPLEETSLSENIESYGTVGNTVVSLEPRTGILYRFPLGNPARKEQLTTTPPEKFPAEYAAPFSLIAYDETRVALLHDGTGDLFLYNNGEEGESFEKISSDAKGAQFSDDGKKLLFWSDWEISVVFTRKWEVQPVRNENERLDVSRFGSPIQFVQWERDYEHVIFSSGNDIRVTELDDRGGRNTTNIITLSGTPLQVSGLGRQNKILFLRPKEDAMSSPEISSITFPEPVGLFGFGG